MSEQRHVRLFRNGRNQAVRIPVEFELPGDEAIIHRDGEKLVIEPVRTKDGARAATRGTTVVKQGDTVLAIMKSRAHHIDVNSDFHDEAALIVNMCMGAKRESGVQCHSRNC